MKENIFALFVLLILSTPLYSQKQIQKDLSIGKIETIDSKILSEKRTLNIYLPDGYNPDSNTVYNTIYLLDGSIDEDFLHIAGLVQFFNLMFKMPPTIVVGIANIDRKRDFTFHTDIEELKKQFPTTGKSAKFIEFLDRELIPYIDKNYKVNHKRMLIGQSLGGLLASEILLKKSNLFTDYLIVSPSLWWDNESMLKNADKLLSSQKEISAKVYIFVGEDEEKIMRKEAKTLFKTLKKSSHNKLKSTFNMMNNEDHATVLHNSIYKAFKTIYPSKY